MPTRSAADLDRLAPRANLLHIGLPKTGTTAIQHAAQVLRPELLEAGVSYPGTALNHLRGANALMERSTPTWPYTDIRPWRRLIKERRLARRAVGWFSYEQIVRADAEHARRFLDELGPDLHVVVTMRNFAALLASAWQQSLKDGGAVAFEPWLGRVLERADGDAVAQDFWDQHDLARVARVWAEAVGPERVSVVVLDRDRPTLLFDVFERMLGLPAGMLAAAPHDGGAENRGLTAPEADLLLRVNQALTEAGEVDLADQFRLIKLGGVAAMLARRTPGRDEPRIALPREAGERAAALGEAAAAVLAETGVTVVGDPGALGRAPGGRGGASEAIVGYPAELVALMASGVVAAAHESHGAEAVADVADASRANDAADAEAAEVAAVADADRRALAGANPPALVVRPAAVDAALAEQERLASAAPGEGSPASGLRASSRRIGAALDGHCPGDVAWIPMGGLADLAPAGSLEPRALGAAERALLASVATAVDPIDLPPAHRRRLVRDGVLATLYTRPGPWPRPDLPWTHRALGPLLDGALVRRARRAGASVTTAPGAHGPASAVERDIPAALGAAVVASCVSQAVGRGRMFDGSDAPILRPRAQSPVAPPAAAEREQAAEAEPAAEAEGPA